MVHCASGAKTMRCGASLSNPMARAKSRAVTSISKYLRNPDRALRDIASRSAGESAWNRRMRLRVPSKVSGSTKPEPDASTSRQMLTLSLTRTGAEQAIASATTKPKFSWCEERIIASALRKAPHFTSPFSMPGQWTWAAIPRVCASCWSSGDQPTWSGPAITRSRSAGNSDASSAKARISRSQPFLG